MTTYSDKLKDPRWQKKRLEILERDRWACTECFDDERTLHVHHCFYVRGRDPWDYPNDSMITLCDECHAEEGTDRKSEETELVKALSHMGWSRNNIGHLTSAIEASGPYEKQTSSQMIVAMFDSPQDWLNVLSVLAQCDYMLCHVAHSHISGIVKQKTDAKIAQMKAEGKLRIDE